MAILLHNQLAARLGIVAGGEAGRLAFGAGLPPEILFAAGFACQRLNEGPCCEIMPSRWLCDLALEVIKGAPIALRHIVFQIAADGDLSVLVLAWPRYAAGTLWLYALRESA